MADSEPRRGGADDQGHAAAQHAAGGGGEAAATALTYAEALDYITTTGRFGVKLGLERVAALLGELGSPQAGLRGALVAGTNGKGSTCAFLEAILRASGLRTGLMPKPHLSSYTERIQIDATPIGEADFADAVSEIRPAVARVAEQLGAPTEFEILTALAMSYLAPRIDVLVCEVGMGGRLDATNVLDPGVSMLTNVALDHQAYLGDTIEKIATEKAAIIKPGDRVVSGCEAPAREIVDAAAAGVGAAVWQLGRDVRAEARPAGWDGSVAAIALPGHDYRDLRIPLLGPWQVTNAALAVAAADALGVRGDAVAAGLAATRWPGRLEVAGSRPRVLLDGGHNPAALDRVVPYLSELLSGLPVALVFGAMEDKDLAAMLTRLRGLEPVLAVFTRAGSAGARAAPPADLAAYWGAGAIAVENSAAALEAAREAAGANGVVLVCGSLYLVGELRDVLRDAA